MDDTLIYIGVGILVAAGASVQWFIWRRRCQRDYREYLEPILTARGLTFISAEYPGLFKKGPFSKFEIEVGRPQSSIGGIRGEYYQYRIVTFEDSEGKPYQVWVDVEFELFKLRRVRWRAENKQDLPQVARSLLED